MCNLTGIAVTNGVAHRCKPMAGLAISSTTSCTPEEGDKRNLASL